MTSRPIERVVRVGSLISVLGLATSVANLCRAPRLPAAARPVTEPVTVCIPARDERDRLPDLIGDLREQRGVDDLRVFVYDDGSTDGTAEVADAASGADPRFSVMRGTAEPPPGWVGKPAACHRVSEHAFARGRGDGGILVFLDADVRLRPGALNAACAALRESGAALVCPWPFQQAGSVTEGLVQPLLAWSWAATLPIRVADRSRRPSTAVACGQFMVFDSAAYRRVGGHRAVVDSVTEDLDIARLLRTRGHATTLVVAGRSASCRMYEDAGALRRGYDRWLWTAFGSRLGAAAVLGAANVAFVAPPVAFAAGRGRVRRWGAVGYLAATTSRLCARALERGDRLTAADVAGAVAHPLSVAAVTALTVSSHRSHHRGRTRWKGRSLS
ncbi:possible glycosyl transferase [Rhodococcus jostii RHA1]|uniref:Possible glycosyl transferase n=1 Tax=Rhodococcus jostii (strain RHA1) TaxID=101510 RepID=Q0SHQ5_RHOJR|nr:glycosyltransferase family 2 protein [Rhodococcus jostii]ABG92931.1 possible glycosyl transferase [Rhodococcus jostii RHA1]